MPDSPGGASCEIAGDHDGLLASLRDNCAGMTLFLTAARGDTGSNRIDDEEGSLFFLDGDDKMIRMNGRWFFINNGEAWL